MTGSWFSKAAPHSLGKHLEPDYAAAFQRLLQPVASSVDRLIASRARKARLTHRDPDVGYYGQVLESIGAADRCHRCGRMPKKALKLVCNVGWVCELCLAKRAEFMAAQKALKRAVWQNARALKKAGKPKKPTRVQLQSRGFWLHSKCPFGYLRRRVEAGFVLARCPDTAPIVKEIFELFAKPNFSSLKVAQELNRRGIKNTFGRVWNAQTLMSLLKNKVYLGRVKAGQHWVKGKHEALVSRSLWRLAHNQRKRRRTGRAVSEGKESL